MRRLTYLGLFLLVLTVLSWGQNTSFGSGTSLGAGTQVGGGSAPAGVVVFSLSGSTLTASGCATGQNISYTTDGTTPTIASNLYTGPLTVTASEVVQALCYTPGSVNIGVQTANTHWKCVTVNGGTSNGLTCQSGGGVGTIQPSAWSQTWGASMAESESTTSSTGTTEMLFVYTGPSSDSSTYMAQHLVIQPTEGSTYLLNNEIDMFLLDTTHDKEIMFGLQANQQSGTLQWQIDNTGSWQNTGIATNVPLPTTAPTTVDYTAHRILGDTGCGGLGCNYYDALCINGSCTALNKTLESAALPSGWSGGVGNQQQPDLTNTTTSGANPTTAGYTIAEDNVVASIGPPGPITTYTVP